MQIIFSQLVTGKLNVVKRCNSRIYQSINITFYLKILYVKTKKKVIVVIPFLKYRLWVV